MESAERAAGPPGRTVSSSAAAYRSGHRLMIRVALAVIALSAVLRVTADDTAIEMPGSPGTRLPPICALKAFTGVRCPGCGLTRSFVAMAHGQVRRAARLHGVGPPLFVLLALQIPYRSYMLRRADSAPSPRPARLSRWLGWAFLAAFLVHWAVALAEDLPTVWG